jgi:glycosyltransferase involved in cell wall biosynthesis
LKVLHVTPSYYPATYWGGPIYSTLGLCDALSKEKSFELRVIATDTSGPKSKDRLINIVTPTKFPAGYEVFYCRKSFGKEFSFEFFRRLPSMIKWSDVVHLTYTFSPPTIPTLLLCRIYRRPVVWSPRGALQRWDGSRRRILKWIWERICNVLVLNMPAVLHVTSTEERQASSKRIPNIHTALIPNGIQVQKNQGLQRRWKPGGVLRLMYMGRIHPIKGVENLIMAISIAERYQKVHLSIYGAGEPEYCNQLIQLVDDLKLVQQIKFIGPVSSDKKANAFINVDVCVVPSFTESFGMVVAESMAHGVPVIASKGTPWQEVEKNGSGLWVDNSPESLASAIQQMSDNNLDQMGLNGRAWMLRDYDWDHISEVMYDLYVKQININNCTN